MNIELTPEQSKLLNDTGECWVIEPMEKQPEEVCNTCETWKTCKSTEAWKGEHECTRIAGVKWELNKKLLKYQPGQKVKVSYDCPECGGHGWHDKIQFHEIRCPVCKVEGKLQLDCIIKEVKVKRVQDIKANIRIINTYGGSFKPRFREFFNNQYSEPMPVKCKECNNGIIKYYDGYLPEIPYKCNDCNGDGIESYISYVYNDDSKKVIYKNMTEEEISSKNDMWNDKPLQIIVNPWIEIPKLELNTR